MARPEPRRWHRAALGGLLMALGGALFGVARKGASAEAADIRKATDIRKAGDTGEAGAMAERSAKAPPKGAGEGGAEASGTARPGRSGARSRPKVGRANVRTKPRVAEAPAHTRYWPPPSPKPIDPPGGVHRAEDAARDDSLPVHRDSEKRGYEVEDTETATVVKIMGFSVAMIVISIAALFWFIGRSHRDDRLTSPLTPQQLAIIVPPGPRLQDHPLHDIALEKQRESDLLTFYAWVTPDRRAARIPIVRAEALVIGRPLDPLPEPGAAPATPPSGPQP